MPCPGCRYTEAIATTTDQAGLHLLYGNRSLAHCKIQRYAAALQDGEAAASLAPKWDKGHWRKATALMGLRDAPGAVAAFLEAWRLTKGKQVPRSGAGHPAPPACGVPHP